jgi:hypothetical protein
LCFYCWCDSRKRLLLQRNCYNIISDIIVQQGPEHLHLALKLVFVLFAAFGLPFPTFSFGFWKNVS